MHPFFCVKVSGVNFDDLVAIKYKNKIIKSPNKLLKSKGGEEKEALWYKTIKGEIRL